MAERNGNHPTMPVGTTVLVVTMEVDREDEAEFNKWYNEQHLPERMEIPGYVSARRFKLEEGDGALQYLCIWELEDGSPLQSQMYRDQQADQGPRCTCASTRPSRRAPVGYTGRSSRSRAPSWTIRASTPATRRFRRRGATGKNC